MAISQWFWIFFVLSLIGAIGDIFYPRQAIRIASVVVWFVMLGLLGYALFGSAVK